MKKFLHCAFKGCGKPCGHYYPEDPDTKPVTYSWCWLRGVKRLVENGSDVDYTYYCCMAHYEGREKKQKVEDEE